MKGNKKDLQFYYLFFLSITGIAAVIYGIFWAGQAVDYKALIQQNIANVTSIEKITGTKQAYKVEASGGRHYVVCDSAMGYQSKIETMSIIDEKGLVEKVLITKQSETPDFFERLYKQNYFNSFNGLSVKEPIFLGGASGYSGYLADKQTGNYIDRVSGSTVSSHAVAEAVNRGNLYLSRQIFNTAWANPYDVFQLTWKELAMIVMYLIALTGVYVKKLARIRIWVLMVSISVLGFLINQFVTANLLFSLVNLQIPGITNLKWYVLMSGSLGVIIFLGKNLYCTWICPFGATQEFLNKIAGFKPLKISQTVIKKLKLVPPTILWVALILGTCLGNYGTINYQPFGAFFLLRATWVMWLMLPIFLFMSLFFNRFYCQFFCPVGFIYNLLNRYRNKGVRTWNKNWNRWKNKKEEGQKTCSSQS
jgi:Na+-translocating ferredoxin:NAD+ oxidoreductase RnfG subunit